MASDSEVDTSRTVVQVYVPAYQRAAWDEHADQLDMSRSEFVKAMVQAGRRGFGADVDPSTDATGSESAQTEPFGDERSPEKRVLDSLEENGPLSWDELLTAVTDDVESRIEQVLETLQDEGKVRHSGPKGGYVLESDR